MKKAPCTWVSTSRPSSSKVCPHRARRPRPDPHPPCQLHHPTHPIHPHVHSSHSATAIVIQSDLHVLSEAKVDFDADFGKQYGLTKGVLVNDDEGEVFAPVAMWLEAIDLVLTRLKEHGAPLHRIRGISGACQQHGSVYWNHDAEKLLGGLDGRAGASLKDLLAGSLSHPYAPNWQDHSTQAQCDEFDVALGDNTKLADVTGSAAHHVSLTPARGAHLE